MTEINTVTNPSMSMQDETIAHIHELRRNMDWLYLDILSGKAEAVRPTLNFAEVILNNILSAWELTNPDLANQTDKMLADLQHELRTQRIDKMDQAKIMEDVKIIIRNLNQGYADIKIGFLIKANKNTK